MKKAVVLLTALVAGQFCVAPLLRAQPSPAIQWQRSFGGSDIDYLRGLQQTSDGGYILGGQSASPPSGNKTSPNYGGVDFWVVRMDANGGKLWEQSFGGSDHDAILSLQKTSDGGFILGGYSMSAQGTGNKTSPNYGAQDFWVIRLDAGGNKLWEQSFGGSALDFILSLQKTSDGGFILGGESYSPPSGNKTSSNYGDRDYWVVRLDGSGNKLWEQTFGGSGDDSLMSLQQTGDGGFILGGYSASLPYSGGGNKTSPFYGGQIYGDFWVVRLDAEGHKLWDKSFGGSDTDGLFCLEQTSDGGFILGGNSISAQGTGNKTSPHYGGLDFWIVRLDPSGTKLWERSFGGSLDDTVTSVQRTTDGGFIVGGASGSDPSGNKTSLKYGNMDVWVVRLDASGNKLWEQSFGGSDFDVEEGPASAQQTRDGGFILGGFSRSAQGTGNKTSPNFGADDFWVVKLGPETAPKPPTFTQQPVSQTVMLGSNATFAVTATGFEPLSYQWWKDGADLTGQTATNLVLAGVQFSDAGNYWAVVTDVAGSATSQVATLAVLVPLPPTIARQPTSRTAEAGSQTGFQVRAAGDPVLAYQWFFNGSNAITGATTNWLRLTNVQPAHAGAYAVVVTNAGGAVTSAPALLSVIPPVERRPVPGILLLGEAGSALNLEYADGPLPAVTWPPLVTVPLAGASQFYFDLSTPLPPQRAYRAWQTGAPSVVPALELHLIPAITLTGAIGGRVQVDGINAIGPIDAWFPLATVTLTNTSQLYFDVSVIGQPWRLYRLVP